MRYLIVLVVLSGCTANFQPRCTANCDAGVLDIPNTGGTELTIRREGADPTAILP